jgi:hypothetical protein
MFDFGKQMLVGSEKNACLEKLMSLYMRISICSMSENSFTMGLGANSLTQAFTVVRIFQMLSNNYIQGFLNTVKSRTVDWSTIQFWIIWAKGHMVHQISPL